VLLGPELQMEFLYTYACSDRESYINNYQVHSLKQSYSQKVKQNFSVIFIESEYRDPCVTVSSACCILNVVRLVVHKLVWMLGYFTLVFMLFSAISTSILTSSNINFTLA